MRCYIIYQYNILDKEKIELLGPLSLPIVEKFGGKLVVASAMNYLEGAAYDHMVAYQFESKEAAQGFYHSKESQELSVLRKEVTEGIAVLMPEYSAALPS